MSDWLIDILVEMNQAMREGKQSAITKSVEDILGRKPLTFIEFVKDYREKFS